MIIFGGSDGKEVLGDLWRLDLPTMTWKVLEPQGEIPRPRTNHCAFVHRGEVFVFGGRGVDDEFFGDLHKLEKEEGKWTKIETKGRAPCGRDRASISVDEASGLAFLVGGRCNTGSLSDCHVLDLKTMTWFAFDLKLPKDVLCPDASGAIGIQRHSMIFSGGKLLVFGGEVGGGGRGRGTKEVDRNSGRLLISTLISSIGPTIQM